MELKKLNKLPEMKSSFPATEKKVILSEKVSKLLKQKQLELQEQSDKKQITTNDLMNDFIEKENHIAISERTFNSIYLGDNSYFPGNDIFHALKDYLGKKDEANVLFIFGDKKSETDYEHQLFIDIIEEAKLNLGKVISELNYVRNTSAIILMLGKYKDRRGSETVIQILLKVWTQFDYIDVNYDGVRQLNRTISDIERLPSLYSDDEKLKYYYKKLDRILYLYKKLFEYDNGEGFLIDNLRFKRFDKLEKLSRSNIERKALDNIRIFTLLVDEMEKGLIANRFPIMNTENIIEDIAIALKSLIPSKYDEPYMYESID